MKTRILRIITTLLMTTVLSCQKESSTNTATTPTTTTPPAQAANETGGQNHGTVKVEVTFNISGAAHLVSDANPPYLILPNFSKMTPPHKTFLLALPDAVAVNGLPQDQDQVDMDHLDPGTGKPKLLAKYKWGDVPEGVAIDLAASGVTFPAPITLDPDDGLNEPCPNAANKNSLHWFPRLWKVWKMSKMPLKPAYTQNPPDPSVVWARYDINGGQVRPLFSPEERIYTFSVGAAAPNDVKQTAAMTLQHIFNVDLPATDPVFVLKGREFKSGNVIELGRFKPFPTFGPSDPLRIEIDLIDIPFDEFFNVHDVHAMPHFDMQSMLIDGAPKDAKAVQQNNERCTVGSKPNFECGPTG